jgi:4-coumarate--CoA ligase
VVASAHSMTFVFHKSTLSVSIGLIQLPQIFYPMLFLGIIAAGGIFTGTNPSNAEFELIHHIKTSKASFLIAEPELLENAMKAATECNIPGQNIRIFNVLGQKMPTDFKSWEELLLHGEED